MATPNTEEAQASKSSRGRVLKRSKRAREAEDDTPTSDNPPPAKKPTGTSKPVAKTKPKSKPTVEEVQDVETDIEIMGETPRNPSRHIETPSDNDWEDSPPPSIRRQPSTSSGRSAQSSIRIDKSDEESSSEGDENDEVPEEDAEAQLARLKKRWNSGIYALFESTPIIDYNAKGQRVHKFKCAARPCKAKGKNGHYVTRNLETADKTSTKLLANHAEGCWGKAVVEAARQAKSAAELRPLITKDWNMKDGSIVAAFKRVGKDVVTYSHTMEEKPEARGSHVRWIAESLRPFDMVKDPGYHHLMKTGRPGQYIPSVTTLRRDIRKVFVACRAKIANLLRTKEGALHFATDAWTSPNNRALVAVTVSYEENGAMATYLLDIVEVAKTHSGENLAQAFADIVTEFDVVEKVLGLACDNASPNDTMTENLEALLEFFDGDASRVRCFCHVINLVAKSVLKQFDIPVSKKQATSKQATSKKTQLAQQAASAEVDDVDKELGGDDVDDEFENLDLQDLQELAKNGEEEEQVALAEDKRAEVEGDNSDGWVDERASMSKEELAALESKLTPARRVLTKVRKIAFSVKNSTTILLPRWKQLCRQHNRKVRVIPRDVSTRWNSSYDMLNFAVEYQEVIDALTNERSSNLGGYEVNEEEWAIAEQLVEVLALFKKATLFFSQKNKALLSCVIPAMDNIDESLNDYIADPNFPPSITSALKIGQKTLNRYYSKTDLSSTYRIAMVLDPRRKLSYFREAEWPTPWINRAERLVRDRFDDKYASLEIAEPTPMTASAAPTSSTTKKANKFDLFMSGVNAGSTPTTPADELAKYLSTDVAPLATEPIAWWIENRPFYPRLSRMALDYLSIPSTSVDVERVFSKGRILLSHTRNRLEAETVRSLLCLNEWYTNGKITLTDMQKALRGFPAAQNGEEDDEELEEGWDKIE